ncbi:hypothetical protein [Modestobacter sp. VKM Ac-2978]|uniref:hypothetical protein n=1 Tax=Modestobacter sp. VKM Ac-2978 TaxID=3004132 RepID=UPI0022AA0A47|nr:hypothetical protein [Modestobacter sp. VKM Ac-2978]MCZ2849663.1 hypothetical protein [Modestobacter sp. VKM Ac-2978]
MSVPGQPRPVPHPPGGARPAPAGTDAATTQESTARPAASPFADLAGRPVAEHVAVFEAEHQRLQRELSTIDQL